MKIVSQSADQLIASDKQYGQLIAAPAMLLVGIAVVVVGIVKHAVIADVIGLVFVVVGIAMLLTRKQRTLTINRPAGTVNFSLKSMTKKGSYDYNIQDIAKIQLLSEYQTSRVNNSSQNIGAGLSFGSGNAGGMGNTQTEQTTKLVLVLKDGTSIDIADGSRSMNTMGVFSSVPNQKVGESIAQFAGLPFENVGPGTAGSVVSAIAGALRVNAQPPAPVVQSPIAPVTPPGPDVVHIGMPDQPGFAAVRPSETALPLAPSTPAPPMPPDATPPAPPDPTA